MKKRHAYYSQKLRMTKDQESELDSTKLTCSTDVFNRALDFWDTETIGIYESFYALYLNRKNTPIAWALISTGGVSGTVVDNKIVFSHALLCSASGTIVFHNHPSGELTPSRQDIELTRKMKVAAEALDMVLYDHIILSPDLQSYYSFADKGLLT